MYHADESTVDNFRQQAIQNLRQSDNYVIINYNRQVLHEMGGGHISPIAAYHVATDMFLLLDSAR